MPRRRPTAHRPAGPCLAALVAGGIVAGAAPVPVRAWAEARARSAQAEVRWGPEGRTVHVALEVDLHVARGWVEGFDLSGLEPELILDPDAPPTVVDRDQPGRRWRPEARVRDGGDVSLRFRRRGAPGRGDYRVHLAYRAPAPAARRLRDGRVELRWSLPPWAAGLDQPRVSLAAPWRLRAPPVPEGERLARRAEVERRDGLWRVTHERVHLPRETRWTVTAAAGPEGLPAAWRRGAAEPSPAETRAPRAPPGEARPAALAPPGAVGWGAAVAWLLLAAAWTAVAAPRIAARRGAPTPRCVVPGPGTLRWLASLGAAAGAVAFGPTQPALGGALVAALGALHARRAGAPTPPSPGVFAPVPDARRRLDRAWLWAGPFDPSAPLGGLTLAAAVAGTVAASPAPETWSAWHLALGALTLQAWLLLPPGVWPEPARRRLRRLRAAAAPLAAALDAPPRPEVLGDPDGAGVVRLALEAAPRPPGVARVDLALDGARLVAIVRARHVPPEAPWAARLDALSARRARGRHAAWVVDVGPGRAGLAPLLAALAAGDREAPPGSAVPEPAAAVGER